MAKATAPKGLFIKAFLVFINGVVALEIWFVIVA